jgi:hypothetical protein
MGLGAADDALVILLVEGDDAGGAEAVLGGLAGGFGHALAGGLVGEQGDGGLGHAFDVADREEAAVDAVVDELGDAADAGGDGGDAAGHRFEGGEAEGLHLAGEEHEVGEGKELVDVVLLAEEVDAVLDAELEGETLGGGAVGAVADQQQAGGDGAGDAGKGLDDVKNAFDRPEVGEMDEELFLGTGELRAHGGDQLGIADVDVAVDEVADDLDLAVDGEGLAGAVAEMAGDGGDAVGLGDAEAGDGEIRPVLADEGDVCAVEGGDEGEMAAAGGEHLAGEQGADRVRDGVVDVEDVERVKLGDLGHAGGQGEIVGGVLEERVVVDLDLVKVDVGLAAGEAEGLRGGDEVDLMAARGELDAQFGGHDAGAAVGGITGDANLHTFYFRIVGFGVGCVGVFDPSRLAEASIVDELGRVWERQSFGQLGEESVKLDLALGAEAGGDGVEFAVIVAGMADKLPDAVGHVSEELLERGGGEIAGGGDADGAVGGADRGGAYLAVVVETGAEAAEQLDLKAAEASAVAEGEAPGVLEGIANGADGVGFGDAQERARDPGEEVGVLVGVEVGDANAGALELVELGKGFALDLGLADLAAEEGLEEIEEGGAEASAVGAEKGGNGRGAGDGEAVGEDDVEADAEGGMGVGDGDGVVEGGAGGHKSGGGEGAGLMELADGAVDAVGEAKVVCVEDEAGGHG